MGQKQTNRKKPHSIFLSMQTKENNYSLKHKCIGTKTHSQKLTHPLENQYNMKCKTKSYARSEINISTNYNEKTFIRTTKPKIINFKL